jgi:hypothetical protein
VGYKEMHNGLLAEYKPEKLNVMKNLRTGNVNLGSQIGYSDAYNHKIHQKEHS